MEPSRSAVCTFSKTKEAELRPRRLKARLLKTQRKSQKNMQKPPKNPRNQFKLPYYKKATPPKRNTNTKTSKLRSENLRRSPSIGLLVTPKTTSWPKTALPPRSRAGTRMVQEALDDHGFEGVFLSFLWFSRVFLGFSLGFPSVSLGLQIAF